MFAKNSQHIIKAVDLHVLNARAPTSDVMVTNRDSRFISVKIVAVNTASRAAHLLAG
jgi:hypothetical protein